MCYDPVWHWHPEAAWYKYNVKPCQTQCFLRGALHPCRPLSQQFIQRVPHHFGLETLR